MMRIKRDENPITKFILKISKSFDFCKMESHLESI